MKFTKLLISAFIFFLLFTFYFLLFTPPVSAQTSTPSASPTSNPSTTSTSLSTSPLGTGFQLPASPATTSPLYTDIMVHNMFHTFSCLMTGTSILTQPCLTYQVTKDAQGIIKSVPVLGQANFSGGALGTTVSIIEALYVNRPIRTSEYLVTLGEDLGLYKEAQAQVGGSGQAILNPVLKLWQVSRNISYVFMILIFVIIGLMVMFRQRINPQTVITAQAAIPGLVIGLLLITFSYFLAALITDMAFIGTNIVGFYFSAASDKGIEPNLVEKMAGGAGARPVDTHNVLTIPGRFLGAIQQTEITRAVEIVFNSMADDAKYWVRVFAAIVGFQFGASIISGATGPLGLFLDPVLGLVAGLAVGALPVQFGGWIVYFIAIAVLIYNMIRLLLRLINNFLNIIFLTIAGPFRFLAASLPGRQGLATDWILDMLCNVLAFPAVAAVFYFVAYIIGFDKLGANQAIFNVSATSGFPASSTFPLFGGLDLSFIRLLLAFGAILAAPAIPDIICRILGRVSAAGQLIGQEMGAQMREGRGYYGLALGGFQADVGSFGRLAGGFVPSRSYQQTQRGAIVGMRSPGVIPAYLGATPTPLPPIPPPAAGGATPARPPGGSPLPPMPPRRPPRRPPPP